jgi:excisionase family DNA binding protein
MENLLVTPEEVAAMLSIGRTKVYELLRSGRIRSIKIGGCRRVPTHALSRFIEDLSGDDSEVGSPVRKDVTPRA